MKFPGARPAILAAAVVAEAAGLGLAVLPARALPMQPAPTTYSHVTVTAGGDRATSNSVSGLGGVRFHEQHANPSTCTTGGNGKCTLTLYPGDHLIRQESAPAGWYLSPQLGISPNSYSTSVVTKDYSSVTVHVPHSGIAVPQSTSGTTTNPYARSGAWAVSRNNPPVPARCGLNVALLFDLSASVDGHLRELQDAGIGFIDALQGTPSSVALYTMGTRAPVNLANNSNFPLTPLTTQANVTALTSKIRGYSIGNSPPQYTNWDQGLWQIASAQGALGGTRVHYDAVIMLNHGDPTVYGPTGIGQTQTAITRFIDVENAIFSANALKAEGTRVIAVGTSASSSSALNLQAISGPQPNRDYFNTSFSQVGSVLRSLALENCSGTVNVTKLVIPGDRQGVLSAAVPAPGWVMSASGPTVHPAATVTNKTGALSFATAGPSEPVTVTENVKTGYTHFPVGGRNATCHNLAGFPVPVTDAATAPGFTVTARSGDIITCQVYNQQQAPSEVTTRLSAADGEISALGSATDSARLHAVTVSAGGSVEYRSYGSLAACDSDVAAFPRTAPSGGTLVSTVGVARGVAPPSAAVTFPLAGTFYWAAFYSGDAGNRPAASDCASEPLVVNPALTKVTTQLSAADGVAGVGGSVSDSATLRAVTAAAGGSVEYRFYGSLPECNGDVTAFPGAAPSGGTLVSRVPVTGGAAPPSAAQAFPSTGTFYWAAFYSGDAANRAAASLCVTEPLVVTPAAIQVTTQLSAADGVTGVGTSVTDTATLAGATTSAGGSVEYRFYGSLPECNSDAAAFPGAAPSQGTPVSTVPVTGGAAPASLAQPFASAGTFYWAAFYSGDAGNRATASNCDTEPLVVTPAAIQVTTQLSAAARVVGVGGSVSDAATLNGATVTAGGSVEYRVYDSLSACEHAVAAFPPGGGGTLVSTVPVAGGAAPPSAAHAFPAPGTFYWAAFYSGDADNQAAGSLCAAEPLVVNPAIVRVTTQLSAADRVISVGGSASDAATLNGATAAAGGTVQYRVYSSLAACETAVAAFPGSAPSGGTLVSIVTVTSGAVPASAPALFPAAGTFYWAAFYSGDPSNRATDSSCVTEPLVVNPAASHVTTQLSAPTGESVVGGSVSDAATLSGATGPAGGSVEYRFYGSLAACDGETAAFPGSAPSGGTLVSTVQVAGALVPPSAAHAFPAAGTFYWAAFYSGDANDQAAASDCATEPLVVNPAVVRVTTHLSAPTGEVGVGGSVSDAATLNGATAAAGGLVEYRFYGSLAACDSETAVFPGSSPSGGTLVSTVTVTSGAVPASATAAFPSAGTFYWAAFYSGDPNNRTAASDCATEPLEVNPAAVTTTTRLSAPTGEVGVGGTASDAATLNGATTSAGGSVEYRFYGSLAACDGETAVFPGTAPSGGTLVSTVTVTNGIVPASAAQAFPSAGTFYWAAFYSGDANDQAAASDCATEPLVVNPAVVRVTTHLSAPDGEVVVGGSVSDAATLNGATGTAGGTVEYRFYGSLAACETAVAAFPGTAPSGGTLVSTVTVASGTVPGSATAAFPSAGTFYWAAFYSGDPSNRATDSSCVTEPLAVNPAASHVTTQLSAPDGEVVVGGTASDTATLNGATGPAGGSVEYRFYGSLAACDSETAVFPGTAPTGGTLVSTVTVTNGIVPASAAQAFPSTGTFYWAAFYSGDPSNGPAASDCATEPLVVTSAPSEVTTRLSTAAREAVVGGSASDTATLNGATGTAGGSVEYRFYGSLAACDSETAVFPGTAPTGGTLVSTVTVTSGAVPASATATFPVAGTFYWAAFYSGDASNLAAASLCAAEPLVVNPAVVRVTTQLSAPDGEVVVGGSVSDLATLNGATGTAGGTVEYRFYGSLAACETAVAAFPGTAPSGGTLVSTVPVTGGAAAASAAHAFPAAGTVYWAAFYSGDPSNRATDSSCVTEPLAVNPAAVQATTRLSASTGEVGVGGSVSDAATLNGATATAGGTVEYRFYGSLAACDSETAVFPGTAPTGGTLVSTVTVTNSVVPASAAQAFPSAGTFYWAAFYSGDANDQAAASDCATEPLVVNPAIVRVTTQLSAADRVISVGGSASDAATLNGATGTAGGTVEYRFYGSLAACETAVAAFPGSAPSGGTLVSTVPVTGGAAPSSLAQPFASAGTFYWAAFYSGDPSNRATDSSCVTEPLVVNPAAPHVTTKLSAPTGETGVGGSVSDGATLSGATGTAGGSLEYRFYGSLAACDSETAVFPGTAPSGGTLVSAVTVTNGAVPASAAQAFPSAGTFYWAAYYSGDANNQAAASDCATEPLVVNPAIVRVTTHLSAPAGETGVGGSVSDAATLNGATGTAGGSVEYRFYGSRSGCEADVAGYPGTAPSGGTLVSTVTVTSGAAPASAPAVFPAAGTFYWAAYYSGDPSNRATDSSCVTEPLVVNPAAVTTITRLSAPTGETGVGGTVSDSATLNGATATAGGTVEYRFYGSLAACLSQTSVFPGSAPSGGTLVSTVTVTNGAVPASAAHAFPAAGTYYWAAFYSGDPSNGPAASDCATEPLVVTLTPVQLTTRLSAAGLLIGVGGSVSDSATLHGATGTPAGSVEYRFYGSLAACAADEARFPGTAPAGGTPVSTVPVTGGVVPASAAVIFTAAGTFYWAAFYSGDASNGAAASDCVTEPLVVTPAPSLITTRLSAPDRVVEVGGSASDSATLRGVAGAVSGTVEYRVYGSLSACDADVAGFPGTAPSGGTLVSRVRVTGGSVPDSAGHAFHAPGTFYWAAFYSGNAANRPAASDCVTEPIVVTQAETQLATRLLVIDGEIGIDGSAIDSATLSGATATAGGSVEYRFYDSLSACQSATSAFPPAAGGTLVSTVPVTRGAVPASAPATFTTPGRYYWAAFYAGDATNQAAASICAAEPLVVTPAPQPPASVIVNLDWVINDPTYRNPNQDPDFQASLVLRPLIPPDQPATWGEERFGYFVGQAIQIGVTDVRIPPGCTYTVSGQVGIYTLTTASNEFLAVITTVCDTSSTDPGKGTHLTLVKQISSDFPEFPLVPLTSWTLTARRAPGEPPVISGTTGVTGNVEPGARYVLAESTVPGYKQALDPALISLVRGATGSWRCLEDHRRGAFELEDFDGGTGEVVVPPGEHVTCTAVNEPAIPRGPAATGLGTAAASQSVPLTAAGLALMAAGALLGLAAVRSRRKGESARRPGSLHH